MNSNKYAFNITGCKKANNELNADIYIPNIDKLLLKVLN